MSDKDKAIWKALGQHWHDYQWVTGIGWVCDCGDKCHHYDLWKENPDLASDSGKVMLLREMAQYEDFYIYN